MINEAIYEKEIKEMAQEVKAWLIKNPGAKISLARPSNVAVIAPLDEALKRGWVKASEDTLKMFRELKWVEKGYTPIMAGIALEISQEQG